MVDFNELIQKRRSIYSLGSNCEASHTEITEIVRQAVKYSPSAFNSQSARVVLLFGDASQKFWQITENKLREIVPAEKFSPTQEKLFSFRKGIGTVLFFEDMSVVEALQKKYPLYEENFPIWSLQSAGMLQYVVWTALTEKNIGASLQHYNPLVDEDTLRQWELPNTWKLLAQMPFGCIEKPAGEKSFEPLENRIKVFN